MVTAPVGLAYAEGEKIMVEVDFSDNLKVTGQPWLTLELGGETTNGNRLLPKHPRQSEFLLHGGGGGHGQATG